MSEAFRVTPESRGENLERWTDEELGTLKLRLMGEVENNLDVVAQINDILAERHDVPEDMLGERPEV